MKTKNVDEANELRWERGTAGHYEVYYITFNHLASKTGFWIRYTMTAPDEGDSQSSHDPQASHAPAAQLWFFFFDRENPNANFGITRRFPIDALRSEAAPFSLNIGDSRLENGALSGALSGAGHSAKWNLTFTPAAVPFLHYPEILYRVELTDTTVLSPHLDTAFSGEVEVDGRKFEFNGDPGDQTHLWGSEHAHQWRWAHCNAFAEDSEAVFEAICARVKRGGVILPPLNLVYLKTRDGEFKMNGPLEILMARGKAAPGSWTLRAQNLTARVDIEITCRGEDLIDAEYHDPNGAPAYCANTETASSRVKAFTRPNPLARWRRAASLTSEGTTHVEWGDRKPHKQAGRKLIVLED